MSAKISWLLLRLLAQLPLPLNHRIGRFIGTLFSLVPNRLRRFTQTNIALCYPDKAPAWRHRLARESLQETGKALTELGPVWCWDPQKLDSLVIEVSGEERVKQALAGGKGVILVTPHIGAWELSSLHACRRFPMTVLFRAPRIGALEPLLRQVRERFGAKLVATTAGGIRALFRALAAGEVVGMLPDQEPRKGAGVFAPFFGVPAYTMVLLSRLARTRRSPVIFAVMERLPAGTGYRLHYFLAPDDIYDPDPAVSATAINRTVQTCIAMSPAQYLWSYKRFRLRPDDGRSPYKPALTGSDNRNAGDFLN